MKKINDAENHYKTSILLDPQSAITHLNFAVFLTDLKRYGQGILHLKKAIALGLRAPTIYRLAEKYNLDL